MRREAEEKEGEAVRMDFEFFGPLEMGELKELLLGEIEQLRTPLWEG